MRTLHGVHVPPAQRDGGVAHRPHLRRVLGTPLASATEALGGGWFWPAAALVLIAVVVLPSLALRGLSRSVMPRGPQPMTAR